jgi:hypothetical protein
MSREKMTIRLTTFAFLMTIPWAAFAADGSIKPDAKPCTPCGNIGYTGCCNSDSQRSYCSKGCLITTTCGAMDGGILTCGWNAMTSYYTCTNNKNADPAGKYPRLCSALPDGGIPDPDKGVTKKDGSGAGCGTITGKGCCDGEKMKYCVNNAILTKDCTSSPKCGWDATKKYYTCGTSGAADPSGANPISCSGVKNDGSVTKDTTGTTSDGTTTTADKGSSTTVDANTTTKKDKGTTNPGGGGDSGCSCTVGESPVHGFLFGFMALCLGLLVVFRRRR